VSAKPEAEEAPKAPAKSKKLLIIIVGVVFLLVALGGGALFFISKQRAAAEAGDGAGESEKATAHAEPKKPPMYLPLDSMVVNLADPGGERVAQVGITLEVVDAHSVESVKAFLPTIRSGILMIISRRTAAELLTPEGKQQLAKDVLREAALPFGGGDEAEHGEKPANTKKQKDKAKSEHAELPVVGVLFSSFIVQ
jgi:flagellar FliL protein